MVGTVSADGVLTITLLIAGREWPAVIDTGFNGDLELPEDSLVLIYYDNTNCKSTLLLGPCN